MLVSYFRFGAGCHQISRCRKRDKLGRAAHTPFAGPHFHDILFPIRPQVGTRARGREGVHDRVPAVLRASGPFLPYRRRGDPHSGLPKPAASLRRAEYTAYMTRAREQKCRRTRSAAPARVPRQGFFSRRTRKRQGTPQAPDLSKGSHIASFTPRNTEKAMIQDGWWTASGNAPGRPRIFPPGPPSGKCFRRVCFATGICVQRQG